MLLNLEELATARTSLPTKASRLAEVVWLLALVLRWEGLESKLAEQECWKARAWSA